MSVLCGSRYSLSTTPTREGIQRTLGDVQLSFGNTPSYSFTTSRILASSSGNEYRRGGTAEVSGPSSPSEVPSSDISPSGLRFNWLPQLSSV